MDVLKTMVIHVVGNGETGECRPMNALQHVRVVLKVLVFGLYLGDHFS